jgi:modulator of FtsH protease HflK
MRRRAAPSEWARLIEPFLATLDAAWQRMHWWVLMMGVLYLISGISVVRSDEVAMVERWGRLLGSTPAEQIHGPGLLLAFPPPIDRVVRVSTQSVREVVVATLASDMGAKGPSQLAQEPDRDTIGKTMGAKSPRQAPTYTGETLDPLTVGYALTGDQNIVHLTMAARYRVRDPVEWAFRGPDSETILRAEVTAAMVRSLGEMGVDQVLAEGRKDLIGRATRRAQEGLDVAHSGLELVSLELISLSPPAALTAHFQSVHGADISAETQRQTAHALAQKVVPEAQASANQSVQAARAEAATELAQAEGAAKSFLALQREYRSDPGVVRERLYRDSLEKALGATALTRWIPPPVAGSEHLRLEIGPAGEVNSSSDQASPGSEGTPGPSGGVSPEGP